MPKKKGTFVVLVLICIAGFGLYVAYVNNDIARLPAATTGATLAELWTSPGEPQRAPQTGSATQAGRTARTAQSGQSAASAATGTGAAMAATAPTNRKSKYAYAKEYGMYPGEAEIPVDKYLICVNRDRALPARYKVNLAVCVENVYPENRMMEKQAAAQYREMYDAARKSDKDVELELIPFSAYRSTAQQKANFDSEVGALENAGLGRGEAIERALLSIQLPGCSEHETGLAIDITRKGVWRTDPGFDGSREFKWLEENAQDYGFILRYPRGKQAVTGVEFEPWHWRYVGVEEAKKIKESGQCLEEYLKIK